MRHWSWKQKSLLLLVVALVYVSLLVLLLRDRYQELTSDSVSSTEPIERVVPVEKEVVEVEVPAEKNLDVPFLVQAPFGVWDELHGEACEEASLIMARYFITGKGFESLESADAEIKSLIAWETDRGYKVDVSVSELKAIASGYYNLSGGRVIENPTVEIIKKEIAAGRPVIVPAAGRMLGNPNFTSPGPPYHMLVIRGYTADEFITNDPGTRNGEGYKYSYQVLVDAMHDWNGSTATIESGPKRVLVFD